MPTPLTRRPRSRDADPQNLPQPTAADPELVTVDTTWGKVQPLQPYPDVPTVGELELIALVEQGAVLVDTRVADSRSGHTLPGAVHLPHDQITDRLSELSPDVVSIVFCNGPQCTQTPDAIGRLLDAGYPAASLAYYRGGLHDWVTLGYPTDTVPADQEDDDDV